MANTPGLAGSLLVGLTAAKAIALACDCRWWRSIICRPTFMPAEWRADAMFFPAWAWSSAAAIRTCIAVPGRPISRRWAARSTMRPARRSTRWPACWACRTRADQSIERAAATAIRQDIAFRGRCWTIDERLDFSFSGLKTAVRY